MASHTPDSRLAAELPAKVLSLTQICPVTEDNHHDCPLHQLRKLSPRERAQWVYSLGEVDLAYLAHYHDICQSIKLETNSARPASSLGHGSRAPARKSLARSKH